MKEAVQEMERLKNFDKRPLPEAVTAMSAAKDEQLRGSATALREGNQAPIVSEEGIAKPRSCSY